jgi:hypothetical protein
MRIFSLFYQNKKGREQQSSIAPAERISFTAGALPSAPVPLEAVAAGAGTTYSMCRALSVSLWPGSGLFCQHE